MSDIKKVLKDSTWISNPIAYQVLGICSALAVTVQLKNAIGYWGLTEYGGEEHTLMVVHALFPDHGAVIVCDATTSVIDQVRGEFEAFLKSMRTPIVAPLNTPNLNWENRCAHLAMKNAAANDRPTLGK